MTDDFLDAYYDTTPVPAATCFYGFPDERGGTIWTETSPEQAAKIERGMRDNPDSWEGRKVVRT